MAPSSLPSQLSLTLKSTAPSPICLGNPSHLLQSKPTHYGEKKSLPLKEEREHPLSGHLSRRHSITLPSTSQVALPLLLTCSLWLPGPIDIWTWGCGSTLCSGLPIVTQTQFIHGFLHWTNTYKAQIAINVPGLVCRQWWHNNKKQWYSNLHEVHYRMENYSNIVQIK